MDLREIENRIRNDFAVLGNRESYLGSIIENLSVNGIRCLIDNKSQAIIIPIPLNSESVKAKFGGIKLETIELGLEYGFQNPVKYVALWCIRFRLREIFIRIIADLLFDLDENNIITQITNRLEGWKLLLSGHEIKSEEKGLWGELYFLRYLLQNTNTSIQSWTGPEGGSKDFVFNNKRAEVKTTAVRSGWLVEMNGIYQADQIQGCTDYLIFNRIEPVRQNGATITELINSINQSLDYSERSILEQKLSNYNNEIIVSTDQWNLLETKIFIIDDRFPSIRNESFVRNSLPSGVITITYTIDLSAGIGYNLNEWQILP